MSSSKSSIHKVCLVPQCTNTSKTKPDKLFISVPTSVELRTQWQVAMGRTSFPDKSRWFCCQDHFDVSLICGYVARLFNVCFKAENDIENYMYLKLMKTGKIRLKPGVIPHIFDCQKNDPSSTIIKEEIDIEESSLDYVKEESELDAPDIVSINQLIRVKQESEVTETNTTSDVNYIKIKEEVLDEETDDLEYKIKEETLDIKEEFDTPDSTTEKNSNNSKKEQPARKNYCDKAVQVNLNLLNVRTIGIQCCLDEEIVVERPSEKRKSTKDHKKTKSKKKRRNYFRKK